MGNRRTDSAIKSKLVKSLTDAGVQPIKGKDYSLIHSADLLFERKTFSKEAINDLIGLYLKEEGFKYVLSRPFYNWLKHAEFSRNDLLVVRVYLEMLEEAENITKPSTIKTSYFIQNGEMLVERIEGLIKGKANDLKETLRDYFYVVIPKANKLNPSILASPRSLMKDFGWIMFIEELATLPGGIEGYLLPTEETKYKEDKEKIEALKAFREKRGALLETPLGPNDELRME